jgi:hypothetical protein
VRTGLPRLPSVRSVPGPHGSGLVGVHLRFVNAAQHRGRLQRDLMRVAHSLGPRDVRNDHTAETKAGHRQDHGGKCEACEHAICGQEARSGFGEGLMKGTQFLRHDQAVVAKRSMRSSRGRVRS